LTVISEKEKRLLIIETKHTMAPMASRSVFFLQSHLSVLVSCLWHLTR